MSALGVSDESQLLLHILDPRKLKLPLERAKYDSSIFRVLFIPYFKTSSIYFSIHAPFRNINIEHPLISYIHKNMYHRDENALADFAISLIFFVTDKTNLDDIMSAKVTRTKKHLGCKYQHVMWDECSEDCRPDYKIWTENYGVITLTHDKFVEWAQIKTENLAKDY